MNKRVKEVLRLTSRMEGVLQKVARTYTKMKKLMLHFTVGNQGSWTDRKQILVSVTEEECNDLKDDEIKTVGRFKTGHEVMHILYTNPVEFFKAKKEIMDKWNAKAQSMGLCLDQELLDWFAGVLTNGCEDGRIENIMVNLYPGLRDARDWYRLYEWKTESLTEETNPVIALFNQILRTATMGIKIRGFEAHFSGTKTDVLHKKCQPHIIKAVKSITCKGCMDEARIMADIVEDFVIENISITQSQKEAMDSLLNQIKELLNHINEDNIKNRTEQQGEQMQPPENMPIIGILQDNGEQGSGQDGLSPDIIIDLRKNPETDDHNEEPAEGEKQPLVIRPEQENPENKDDSSDGLSGEGFSQEKNAKEEQSEGEQTAQEHELQAENAGLEEQQDKQNSSSRSDKDSSDRSESSKDQSDYNPEGTFNREKRQKMSEEELLQKVNQRLEEVQEKNYAENKKVTRQIEMEEQKKVEEEQKAGKLSKETLEKISDLHNGGEFTEVDLTKLSQIRKEVPPPDIKRRGLVAKNQLENIMASLSEMDKKEVYEGALDDSELGRFVLGYYDVFKEDGEPFELDMCCYLLKDNSGSMCEENKDKDCCLALATVEEALKDLMPLKISDFCDSYNGCIHQIIKNWEDRERHNYSYSYWLRNTPNHSNDDAYSIDVAAHELMLRPESKKLLVIFSDGSPCCERFEVRQAVENARKNGIFVISFFFGSEGFISSSKDLYEDMYGKYFIGVTPEDIGREFIKFAKIFVNATA